jgi:hypothetical protein
MMVHVYLIILLILIPILQNLSIFHVRNNLLWIIINKNEFLDGSSCNKNQGYCDRSHQCLPLLLDQNTNLISSGFSSLLLTNYSAIFKRYWWIFILFLLAQIILIPIVLLYFRSHCIPSDNPFLQ